MLGSARLFEMSVNSFFFFSTLDVRGTVEEGPKDRQVQVQRTRAKKRVSLPLFFVATFWEGGLCVILEKAHVYGVYVFLARTRE